MKNRKTRSDSATGSMDTIKALQKEIEIPDFVEEALRDEDRNMFYAFLRARSRNVGFNELELLLLVRIARLETEIAKLQDMVDRSGYLVNNKRGTLVPNPILTPLDGMIRQQLSMITKLSLTAGQNIDPKTIRQSALEEKDAIDMLTPALEKFDLMAPVQGDIADELKK